MLRENLTKMLKYCMQAYGDNLDAEEFKQIFQNNCVETDVTYFTAISPDTALIVFRGTDSVKDLATNLNFGRKIVPYGNYNSKIRVHSGFITAYKNADIRGKITKTINDDIKNIRVTGHSYGAALAVLCALDFQYHDNTRNIEVVVFGSPRIGNRAFVKSYNRRVPNTTRIENGNDFVTKVPFGFLGYRHVEKCFRIGNPRMFCAFSFKDHSLSRYYKNLVGNTTEYLYNNMVKR